MPVLHVKCKDVVLASLGRLLELTYCFVTGLLLSVHSSSHAVKTHALEAITPFTVACNDMLLELFSCAKMSPGCAEDAFQARCALQSC